MKLELITLGNRPPEWVRSGVDEYCKRMPRDCSVKLRELALPKRGRNTSVLRNQQEEARKISSAMVPGARQIVMDVSGRMWSTEELATKLQRWMEDYGTAQFVVGGPDGLLPETVEAADDVWSLSRLTFPHFIVPILVSEQLYRAWTILTGHPYHR